MAKNCKAGITSSVKPGVVGARFTRYQKGHPQGIAITQYLQSTIMESYLVNYYSDQESCVKVRLLLPPKLHEKIEEQNLRSIQSVNYFESFINFPFKKTELSGLL